MQRANSNQVGKTYQLQPHLASPLQVNIRAPTILSSVTSTPVYQNIPSHLINVTSHEVINSGSSSVQSEGNITTSSEDTNQQDNLMI